MIRQLFRGATLALTLSLLVAMNKPADPLATQLSSDDPQQVATAIASVRTELAKHSSEESAAAVLDPVMAAKQYQQAQALAIEAILAKPEDAKHIAPLQKVRAQAFLAMNKPDEALQAAKAYYNVCPLANTADAIELVSICLAAARPEQAGIARQFKAQQIQASQVSDAGTPSTQPVEDLGKPILDTVEIDPKPYEAAIGALVMNRYSAWEAKGNLLLLAGRASEARVCFEQGVDLAQDQDLAQAIEGVARSIRAQAGNIGAANAYILAKRQGN